MFTDSRKSGHFRTKNIPSNKRLWEMMVARAKMRFHPYPSLAASHWIHQEYVKQGGQFSKSQTNSESTRNKREKKRNNPEKQVGTRKSKDTEKQEKAESKKEVKKKAKAKH